MNLMYPARRGLLLALTIGAAGSVQAASPLLPPLEGEGDNPSEYGAGPGAMLWDHAGVDPVLDRAQFLRNAQARFQAIDANADDMLTPAELQRFRQARLAERRRRNPNQASPLGNGGSAAQLDADAHTPDLPVQQP